MLLALLLAQASLLTRPLYLAEAPPELRAARHLVIACKEAPLAPAGCTRPRELALELAGELARRARSGEDFLQLVREHSDAGAEGAGSVLGSFARGMLAPNLDEFLFSAGLGDVSEPLPTPLGYTLVQRIESEAAVCMIQIDVADPSQDSAARARCAQVLARLSAGADFGLVARESSDEPLSRERGGKFAIYERGSNDQLLKSAAFELHVGQVSEPLRSPFAYHILKRVAPGDLDPSLRENHWVRLRVILVQYDMAEGADMTKAPGQAKAREIVDGLAKRLAAGEEMEKLAAEFDDDRGGRARKGDLGWIHRGAPNLTPMLRQATLLPPGKTSEPLLTPYGYLLVRRER